MKITPTRLPEVLLIELKVFQDSRGYFMESYQRTRYREHRIDSRFCQDNISFSVQNTLRGLHYQYPQPQAKLIQVLKGEIFDVAVDIRMDSATFGQWVGVRLNDENHLQLYIPEGFAHGFAVLSSEALFSYKCSDVYAPDCEGGIIWDDPDLAISWPIEHPILSPKDAQYSRLKDVSFDRLPSIGGE